MESAPPLLHFFTTCKWGHNSYAALYKTQSKRDFQNAFGLKLEGCCVVWYSRIWTAKLFGTVTKWCKTMCRYVKVWHIGFLCVAVDCKVMKERERRAGEGGERICQKGERERPTRHSHYLIHGTPSQPSHKSLVLTGWRMAGRWKQEMYKKKRKSPESHCFKLNKKDWDWHWTCSPSRTRWALICF